MPEPVTLLCNACETKIRRQSLGQRGHWCPKCKQLRGNNGVHQPKAEPPKPAAPKPAAAAPPPQRTAPVSEPPEDWKDVNGDDVDVTEVRGIGEATAEKLAGQGITTVKELVQALETGVVQDERLSELVAAHLASEQ
jgi:predicted flap endonuclease-1-like 5' DNA nuclease